MRPDLQQGDLHRPTGAIGRLTRIVDAADLALTALACLSVLAIMGEKVRIGIEAPRSVPVFRKEVYVEIQEDSDDTDDREETDLGLHRLRDTG